MELHGLVETRGGGRLDQRHGLTRVVEGGLVDLLSSLGESLSWLWHLYFTSIPIERAVPSTIFIALSMSSVFRSGIFTRAISRT